MTQTRSWNWGSKLLAGTGLGLALALGVSSILVSLLSFLPLGVAAQAGMWGVVPVWLSVLGASVAFRRAGRLWLGLGGATVVVWAIAFLLRTV
ncbi:hypothetical protein [Pararhodospirillum photometricum]|nr:hypothetical protein [Pararhodospirillum photometricum]